MQGMSPSLRLFLRSVDIGMILYWGVSALACLGLFNLPLDMMYGGYGTVHADAWNWSFAPLDLAFALCGLWSLRLARAGDPRWKPMCLISLILTMCAGGMAVSYWAILGEFDPSWWIPNLLLLVLPLIWLPNLLSFSAHKPENSAT